MCSCLSPTCCLSLPSSAGRAAGQLPHKGRGPGPEALLAAFHRNGVEVGRSCSHTHGERNGIMAGADYLGRTVFLPGTIEGQE